MSKAIRIDQPNQISLVDVNLPSLSAKEILIKVMASGICGTDVHILRGGYFSNYPIIPGHEFSGIVEKVGFSISRFKMGDHVAVEPNITCDSCYNCLNNRQNFCLNWEAIGVTIAGGMSQYVIVPEKAAFLTNQIPFEHAAFMEPLSCVLHGIEKIRINSGDKVVILGAGPIGLLFLQIVPLQGASHISVIEKKMNRAKLAKQYNADQVFYDLNDLEDDYFDVVIDATGDISLMEKSVDLVRPGGKVLLFGVPTKGKRLKIEAIKIFRKGLSIFSSFTSLRNSYQALSLLENGKVNVGDIISHRLPLSEFERGVGLIEKGEEDVKKVIILPQE